MTKETASKSIGAVIYDTWVWACVVYLVTLVMSVPLILAWQVLQYLRYGSWPSLSVIDALQWFNVHWANAPTGWWGLYRVLDWIPMSLFFPLATFALVLIIVMMDR
jgi:hypothetical protein